MPDPLGGQYSTVINDVCKSNKISPKNHWRGTPFDGLHNKVTGNLGEEIIAEIMKRLKYKVEDVGNGLGHDKIIDGFLTEIKTAKDKESKNNFVFNHIASGKDWERLIVFGINRHGDPMLFWFSKKDFEKCKHEYFSPQQGGKHGGNDDYMCSGQKARDLSVSKYAKRISQW